MQEAYEYEGHGQRGSKHEPTCRRGEPLMQRFHCVLLPPGF